MFAKGFGRNSALRGFSLRGGRHGRDGRRHHPLCKLIIHRRYFCPPGRAGANISRRPGYTAFQEGYFFMIFFFQIFFPQYYSVWRRIGMLRLLPTASRPVRVQLFLRGNLAPVAEKRPERRFRRVSTTRLSVFFFFTFFIAVVVGCK